MLQRFLKTTLVLTLLSSLSLFAKDVSPYFTSKYRDEASLTKLLNSADFEVLGSYKLDRRGEFTTLVFTSKELKALSQKKNRGFFAIGRAIINSKSNEVRISNPCYFGMAFLQDDFEKSEVQAITKKLKNLFGDLTATTETVEDDDLGSYRFSFGMPYYEDMVVVAKGKDLASKVKDPIFSVSLSNGSTIVGVELERKTKKFPKKIGIENGLLLPYAVLIEGEEAKILDPRYYLSISYPNLSMGDFMKIASIPDAINKDIESQFK
jgi:hypothetical protein